MREKIFLLMNLLKEFLCERDNIMQSNRRADFGIINFWWCDDHGAILTAFALQSYLEEHGYSSELLKCWKYYDDEKRKNGISWNFEKKHLKTSENIYRTYDDIYEIDNNKKLNDDYIGFITGSDQVFRPDYVPDSWYLTFVNGKGKLAVSASFGISEFICPDRKRFERIKKSLEEFDYISVREDSGVKICNNYFEVDAFHMLDPVFLINKDKYEKIIKESKKKKNNKYIFCYIRDLNSDIMSMIDNININNHYELVWCDENMPVEDFLFNTLNCDYMITDSYHGMCFAIIFNKNFLCIRNELRGKARFISLQKQLGLNEESFLDEVKKIDSIMEIDYTYINQRLKMLSEKCSKWLKMILNEVYQKYR